MNRYQWASRGDVNAFFGLMLDNVAVMIVLVVLVTSATPVIDQRFTREFVLTQMIPGTSLGVLIGDVIFTWLAFRLARRTNRSDVTAMPLGLDTPSTLAVGPLVLLPALKAGMETYQLAHEQAMIFAWHVGALVLVLSGLFKTAVAPLGGQVRRWVPRAGLLGSLTAIALALIAFVPLWLHIATVPIVGLLSLTVILVTLIAHRALPGQIPGALAAVGIGTAVYWIGHYMNQEMGWTIIPLHTSGKSPIWRLPGLLPDSSWSWMWWEHVGLMALNCLPVMLPFALATIVGGIDCTESAAVAGDDYNTRSILLSEGIATLAAGLCGGVIQTTPYIGQPAYKKMGGRAAYTLATAIFIGLAGLFGWYTHLFEWLPEAALFPILVFVGLEITAQSFHATPVRHYAAITLAVMPALAYLALFAIENALGEQAPAPHAVVPIQALRCLSNGFIVTSLLWAAALAAIIDDKLLGAAGYLIVASLCSLIGVIHSPLPQATIAWPQDVYARMEPAVDAILCQSPFHWSVAYGLAALLLVILSFFRTEPVMERRDETSLHDAPAIIVER